MPSVSATHGWILWEIAKARLTDAGYYVRKETTRLVVRNNHRESLGKYMTIVNGKCSPRTLDRLLKKKGSQ